MKISTASTTEGLVETNSIELHSAQSPKGAYALYLLRRAAWCLPTPQSGVGAWCTDRLGGLTLFFHNSKLLKKRNINNTIRKFICKHFQFNLSP